ncbi:acetylglutamate kinase [Anditalea andensis]|uniref:Acetylglutamate kinase n=1 Tax=Anditalea andensis TaxID=1048983 RepID=A0A074LPK5_9BACT|nr:acetylglutamate kinase [Anditalea andensis]KEO75862.1 acetylglutamate kinase [Anditalea andensis]
MKISIIKIGGNVIDFPDKLDHFLSLFEEVPGQKVLVHGGGVLATRLSERLGITPNMVEGRRITDQETLEVVTMVYAGLVNKQIVAKLQSHHINAMGLSGADGNLIRAIKRPVGKIDYGYVGDVQDVNAPLLEILLEKNCVPVVPAITHDGSGQLLNTNADTIAAEIGIALAEKHEVSIFYCFDKKGVLKDISDEDSFIPEINFSSYEKLKEENVIHSGMIPKLDNAFKAISKGILQVWLGRADQVHEAIKEEKVGTFIRF